MTDIDLNKILFINFETDNQPAFNASVVYTHINNNSRINDYNLILNIMECIKNENNPYPHVENFDIFNSCMTLLINNKTYGYMHKNIEIENIDKINNTNFMNFVKYIFKIAFEYNIELYKYMPMLRVPLQLIYVQMQQLFYGIINMYFLRGLNQNVFNDMLKTYDTDKLTVKNKNKRLLALLVAPLFNSYAITTYYYMLYKLVGFKGYNVYITDKQYIKKLLQTAFNDYNAYDIYVDEELDPTQLNMLQYYSFVMYKLLMNNLLNPNNNDEEIAAYIEIISLAGCYNISEMNYINRKLVLLHSVINTYTPYNYYNNIYITYMTNNLPKPKPAYNKTYIDNKLIDKTILTKKTYDKTTHNEIFFKYLFEKINETYKPMYESMYYSILYYSCFNTNLKFSFINLDINSLYNINDQYINNINKITDAILDNYLSKTNDKILYIYKSRGIYYKKVYLPDKSIIYDDIITDIEEFIDIYDKTKPKRKLNRQPNYDEFFLCLSDILRNETSSIDIDYLINI